MSREEIYKGESLTIVLRCRDRQGNPVDMAGKRVEVVMVNRKREVIFNFTTEAEDRFKVTVESHYLICPLTAGDMSRIRGVYLVEIRVRDQETVQIAQLPGVRVLDSITGNHF